MRWILTAALLLVTSLTHGQMTIEDREFKPYEPIDIKIEFENVPEGAEYKGGFVWAPGAQVRPGNVDMLYWAWAPPSPLDVNKKAVPYEVTAVIQWGLRWPIEEDGSQKEGWKDFGLVTYQGQFIVSGGDDPVPPPPPPGARGVILEETDPRNPLFAALWQKVRRRWPPTSDKPAEVMVYDDDKPEAQKYVRLVADVTARPLLLVLSENGTLVRSVALTTESSVADIERELGK
jgi:hypothetical protein